MENSKINNRLRKSERLYLRKEINLLFSKNSSFVCYPIRVLYKVQPSEKDVENPSILVSVSKRNFKRANKRNYIKRVLRESYRLNKNELVDFAKSKNLSLHVAFLFIGKELPDFKQIEIAIKKCITTIIHQNETTKEVTG